MIITGQLHSFTIDRNGQKLITIATNCNCADEYDNLHGQSVKCEIKANKPKRSLDANAYMWALLDKLAAKTGIPKTETYRHLIKEIGGNSAEGTFPTKDVDRICREWSMHGIGWITEVFPTDNDEYSNVILYAGSSEYDSSQMSRLIDLLIQECDQQGIETITPNEKDLLIDNWRTKHD